MKRVLLLLCFLNFYFFSAMAQDASLIEGIWWNEDRTTKIEVELKDGKYIGTVVYMIPEKCENGQSPKDKNNPDPALQDRPIVGLRILEGFVYNAKKNEWKDGTIYDPVSGKTYDCFAKIENDNLMKLRGFVAGMRLLGRTSQWFRTEL
ncbi:MAG: hypothetical protein BWX62_00588 [Bacteroidetes bacterium ADurb.Bin037]|nr:MAG: hypothetical protein BWX62_00588 [Bacteroidetes bacterium ADurb.Bin037]HPW79140.1 DUF2147 domain-containing protein [Bacteroidales bacterium]HQB55783.1 DUF2147 domain-containing protein [Bacteroidales bacterium]